MAKYLITGFSGFVSKHFLTYLNSLNVECEIIGIDIFAPDYDLKPFRNLLCRFVALNMLDSEKLYRVVYQFKPDFILHLASVSSVGYSWKNPVESFSNNTNIFLNLVDSVRLSQIKCRILSVGSSEEYGNVTLKQLPLSESTGYDPVSPYAVARVSQELLSKVYVKGYGLDMILTRSFNHIGPGQKDIFVVSSFARQMVEIAKSGNEGTIQTGDLSIIRDFVDVRDVVRAYYWLLQMGRTGELYNICSGKGVQLNDLITIMSDILQINVKLETNPDLVRPSDNKIIYGTYYKIADHIKWRPKIPLNQSIYDLIEWWLKQ